MNKKRRVLMITCLSTSKEKYDGEYVKNTLIFNSLKKKADVDVISVSTHKIINSLKIFLYGLFLKSKYDSIIISKDPHGANIIHKILHLTGVDSRRIIYFEIGPFLYDRINNGTIKKKTFIDDRLIIVETESMKHELQSLGFERIDVFPNFKPVYDVPFNELKYPKETLKLVYLSRIEDKKGIYDLVDCLKKTNEHGIVFSLDIYGRPQTEDDNVRLKKMVAECSFLTYKGKIEVNSAEIYRMLSNYDFHVFPTKYSEGFPGTIIDFFIAGVPTISSSFARAHEILREDDSVIFKQDSNDDMFEKLKYVYNNQTIIPALRKQTYSRRNEFSVQRFENYLELLFSKIDK